MERTLNWLHACRNAKNAIGCTLANQCRCASILGSAVSAVKTFPRNITALGVLEQCFAVLEL